MKKIFLLVLCLIALPIKAQNKKIEKVITTFFEGFHAKDSIVMKSVCTDTMILQSISESSKGTELKNQSPKDFYRSIASIPATTQFEERILDYSIQIDGAMAHAWTPYEFYINGNLSHKGVNAFTLYKDNGQWKIIYIIDTRRK